MALRNYQPDQYEYSPKENKPRYHSYQAPQYGQQFLKELLFFSHIALFSILTVCATFFYLSIPFNAFFSLLLGMGTGFTGLFFTRLSLKKVYHRQLKR